mgnify:CR=1 FL=1
MLTVTRRDKLYEDITIPAPPKDDIVEAAEVKRLIANRTAEQEKSIADHDEVPFYAIKKYCDDNKMMFHKDEFKDIIYGKISKYCLKLTGLNYSDGRCRFVLARHQICSNFNC